MGYKNYLFCRFLCCEMLITLHSYIDLARLLLIIVLNSILPTTVKFCPCTKMGKDRVFSMIGRAEISCTIFRPADTICSLAHERNERQERVPGSP